MRHLYNLDLYCDYQIKRLCAVHQKLNFKHIVDSLQDINMGVKTFKTLSGSQQSTSTNNRIMLRNNSSSSAQFHIKRWFAIRQAFFLL